MSTFIEGQWQFTFDEPQWNVLKYDGDGGPYRTRICKIPDTKGVDFVGVHKDGRDTAVLLLEVSDYSRDPHRLEKVIATDELLREVAQKFRDTFAGILLLCCMNDCPETIREAARQVIRADCKMRIVFWLCQCPVSEKKMRSFANVLNQRLKSIMRVREKQPFVFIGMKHAMIPGLHVTRV